MSYVSHLTSCVSYIKRIIRFALVIALALASFSPAIGQGFYTEFGQNRVQFHNFEWSYYESDNFITYFYQGGQELGKFTVLLAETQLDDISSRLEYNMRDKIQILVYHNVSDMRQTNIGLAQDPTRSGGITKIIGNKMFVAFDGNHQNLQKQIRSGITRIYLENMVHGGNIQEVLQNAVLLNLPNWFVNGLINYVSEGWNTDMDNRLRKGILEGKYENFNKLSNEESDFAGHALWHYIEQVHGAASIPNLLYLTRINRSVESGFLFVLGTNLAETIYEFNSYYGNIYESENAAAGKQQAQPEEAIRSKNVKKKNIVLDELKVSPNGKYIAYASDEIGRQKVMLYNTETNKRKVILRTGFKSHKQPLEPNYPLLAWDKRGKRLAVVYEKRDHTRFMLYDVEEEKKEYTNPIEKFEQVVDMSFTNDPDKMVMSAVKKGQIDIYTYYIPNTKTTQLTKDFYDDLQPQYIETDDGFRGIVFRSNRMDDTLRTEKLDSILPIGNFDLFFYDLRNRSNVLGRITETPLANETLPMQYDDNHLSFLSDLNGIRNLYVAQLDSIYIRTDRKVFFKDSLIINPTYAIEPFQAQGLIDTIIDEKIYKIQGKWVPISNNEYNLDEYDIAQKSGEVFSLQKQENRYNFYKQPRLDNPMSKRMELPKTVYRQQLENRYASANSARRPEGANVSKTDKNAGKNKSNKRTGEKKHNAKKSDNKTVKTDSKVNKPQNGDNTNKSGKDGEIDIDDYFFTDEYDNGSETPEAEQAKTEMPTDSLPKQPSNDDENVEHTGNEPADYDFQTEFDFWGDDLNNTAATEKSGDGEGIEGATASGIAPQTGKQTNLPEFKRTKVRIYKPKFTMDEVVTQLDNSIIFNQYESFNANGVGFPNPDLNAFIKVGITDLMEDHRIIGGFRVPVNLSGSELFLEYWSLKKRLDKKTLLYRSSNSDTYGVEDAPIQTVEARTTTNYLQQSFIYPFDINRSARAHIGYRDDRITFRATEIISLIDLPDFHENWFFGKLEYIFDNTINLDLNLLNGSRFKVYAEMHKPFEAAFSDNEFKFKFKDTGWLGIIGGDFRHYQKVHKQIVWANRFSSAWSFGTRKMIYYLGGVENWLIFDQDKKFDYTTPIDLNANYGFQSLATNLRGFKQNVRNGTSYALLNSELRVPIFAYIARNPLRSDFLRSFQVVGFFDVGTAWDGLSPFNDENRYTTLHIDASGVIDDPTQSDNAVVATVRYFRNPIVAGYGAGVRAKLLGYFFKADVAWGLDSGARTDARWYFSLGTDF